MFGNLVERLKGAEADTAKKIDGRGGMLDTVLEYVGALTALFIGIMIIVKVAGITIIGNDSPLYTVYTGLITTVGDVFSALGMVLVIGALIMVLGLVYAIKGRTGGGGTV